MELRDRVEHITQSTAALYGCNSTISYSPDYNPPTVNDATLFQWSKAVGAMVSKEGYLRDNFLLQQTRCYRLGSTSTDNMRTNIPRTVKFNFLTVRDSFEIH